MMNPHPQFPSRPTGRLAQLTTIALLLGATLGVPIPAAADEAPTTITADGGRYFGPLRNGQRHGEGRIEWANGSRFEGRFVDGLFDGIGKLTMKSGLSYTGEFRAGLMHGHGRLVMADGSVYEGQFRDDEMNGQGTLRQPGGEVYTGAFASGLYSGSGHFKDPHIEYRGEFRQGRFNGEGELQVDDGRKYRGGFVNGKFEGKGRFESANGDVYEGEFAGDQIRQGTQRRGGAGVYEGPFDNWQPHGSGRFTSDRGDVYAGNFEHGALNGPGTLSSPGIGRYEGNFKLWRFDGQGRLALPNGDVYEGTFANGFYDGQGTLIYATPREDGRRRDSGQWRYGDLVDAAADARTLIDTEVALYTQRRLLDAALERIEARRPGRPNLFLLGLAGDGSQEVFRREVDFVEQTFARRFDTGGHSLSLINSRKTLASAPMATRTSLREGIARLAGRMDREQDILFVFLSSHGSEKHELVLDQKYLRLPELPAAELRKMLDEAGIRWRVVLVSACYSGGFIDALKNDTTLVMTASRHDRKSFGCADENDFTYFGRAYFEQALPAANSFAEAFERARTLVAERERKEFKIGEAGVSEEHSEPQIHRPAAIERHLARWWDSLPASKAVSATPVR